MKYFKFSFIIFFSITTSYAQSINSSLLNKTQKIIVQLLDSSGVPITLKNGMTASIKIEDDSPIKYDSIKLLKDLDIPNAPGFALMDESPTSIERPSTIKEFVISVSNSFTQNKGIPDRYAVEFSPYWFRKPAKSKATDFFGVKQSKNSKDFFNYKNVPLAASKFSSFSLAYIEKYKGADSLAKYHIMSLGVRIPICKIYTKQYNADITASFSELTKVLIDLAKSDLTDAQIIEVLLLQEKPDSVLKSIHDNLNNLLLVKPVFALDAAFAISSFFREEKFSTFELGRAGAWITSELSKSVNRKDKRVQYINFLLQGKVLYDHTNYDASLNLINTVSLDGGIKLEYEVKNKFFLGLEAIGRLSWVDKKRESTFRTVGTIKYRVTDDVQIIGAFGKNFNTDNNIVASLGINLGFGSKFLNFATPASNTNQP